MEIYSKVFPKMSIGCPSVVVSAPLTAQKRKKERAAKCAGKARNICPSFSIVSPRQR